MTEITPIEYLIPVITGTVLLTLLTVFIVYFVLLYRKTQISFEFDKEKFKQELLKAEIEIKEETLAKVSRELHDNYGQTASLIKINLHLLSDQFQEKDREKIEETKNIISQLITDIKHLSSSLNGDNVKKKGWINVLKSSISQINQMRVVVINFSFDEPIIEIPEEHQVIFYRVIQELLNNTLKHAKASKVNLSIFYKANNCTIDYKDDGIGFDPTDDTFKPGAGLENIKLRCSMLNAILLIDTAINKGVHIKIKLDYDKF